MLPLFGSCACRKDLETRQLIPIPWTPRPLLHRTDSCIWGHPRSTGPPNSVNARDTTYTSRQLQRPVGHALQPLGLLLAVLWVACFGRNQGCAALCAILLLILLSAVHSCAVVATSAFAAASAAATAAAGAWRLVRMSIFQGWGGSHTPHRSRSPGTV